MGDSSVSCALSGLTLQSEPAVFIPLIKSKYTESLIGARLIGSGSQACALLSPLTLPYRGELDSYGRFESIVKDDNTSLIETCLGMSIEKFTEACIFGDWITVSGEQVRGAGCFVQSDIYDRFSQPITGGKYAGSLWRSQFAGRMHLEAIGCQFSHDLGDQERYRYVYKHPEIEAISFRCDDSGADVVQDATGETLYGYGLDDMHVALRKAGYAGFPKQDIAKVRAIRELQEIYKAEVQALLKAVDLEKRTAIALEESPQPLSTMLFQFAYLRLLRSFDENLLEKYIEQFAQGLLLDRVEQLVYLLWSFTYANRVLMPTISGTQYPEHEITSVFTGYVDEIALKRIRNKNR